PAGRPGEILAIVDAFRLATEEARRAMLGNIAARRDHRRVRQQAFPELEELVLVAAGAVKDEQDRRSRRTGTCQMHITVMAHVMPPLSGVRWFEMLFEACPQMRMLRGQLQRLAEMGSVLVA